MMPGIAIIGLLFCMGCNAEVSISDMFPFGTANGDGKLVDDNDGSTPQLNLSPPFKFFGKNKTSLKVNTNGAISFSGTISVFTPKCEPLNAAFSMVCPFWCDVAKVGYGVGDLYYRQSTSPVDLAKATIQINTAYPALPPVNITWAYIATWDKVLYFGAKTGGRTAAEGHVPENTFQAILASDGSSSFVILYYNKVTWTTGTADGGSSVTGLGGKPARAGFDLGDGHHYYNIQGSCTSDIVNLANKTNIGSPGKFVFRVDQDKIADPPTLAPTTTPLPTTTPIPTTAASTLPPTTTVVHTTLATPPPKSTLLTTLATAAPAQPVMQQICSGHGRCICDAGFTGSECNQTVHLPHPNMGCMTAWRCKTGYCEQCNPYLDTKAGPYYMSWDECQKNCT